MDSTAGTEGERSESVRRQEVVAELGQRALDADDLDAVLREACVSVADALAVEYAAALDRRSDGAELCLREGVGWPDDRLGSATVPADRDVPTGAALRSERPVVVDDLGTDDRFAAPELLADHGVVSGVCTVLGPIDDPWGVLSAHATEPGAFTDADAAFLRSVAAVLGTAIEKTRTQRRFDAIFDDPNILVGLLEPDGTVVDINETAMEYVDADLEGVVGEPFWETPWWGNGDGVQSDVRAWTERAAAGEYVEFEADLTRPDDSRYTLEGVFRPVTNDEGEVVSIVVSDRDVTERRARERELEKSERRYQTLVENFPNGAVALVDEDLRYTTFGGTLEGDADRERSEIEGERIEDALPEEHVEVVTPGYEAALDGEQVAFEDAIDDRTYQFHFVPVRDDDGDIFAAMGLSQDVTERKEHERHLREAKTQLEAATEAGTVGTWEWRVREDRMITGPSFARTFGVDPDAAREGVSLDRFIEAIHEADRERVAAAIEDVLERGGEYREEYRVWDADDDLRWVIARGHVEHDEDGDPVRFPGALVDITERKRAERALERHRRQLETLFDVLPVGVVVGDEDGRLVNANDTAKELWGGDVFDAESVEDYDRYRGWWADTGDPVAPDEWTMARVLDGEEVTEPDVYEIDAVDGEHRTIEVRGMPIRDEDGEVIRGVVTQSDITERRESQRELEESERRYRTLVENFPNGAVALFDEDLRYQIVGGSVLDEVDASPDEIVGRTVEERYPDELAEKMARNFRAALDGEVRNFELEYHDRHWYAYTLPVTDEDGDVFAGMVMVQDITDRKQMERELRESEARLRMVAENLDEVVWMATPDVDEFIYVNPTYETVFEQDREALYEDPYAFERRLHPEDRDRVLEAWNELPDEPYEAEFRIVRPGGDVRWIHAQATRVHDERGAVTRIVGVANDVTERKRREQRLEELIEKLEASNERLEQFAYAASHDLQEPLRMVSSYLQLIERRYADELDADGEEFLDYAVDGAERMREMIDGLLQYSRVDTRGDPLEPIELEQVLDDALENLQMRIEEHDAEITADSLPRVRGDESQLRQVFQNLLDNAIEYSGDGPPRIHVGAERDGTEWEISVCDEGIGIDPDDEERIFEVFQRLHSREEHAGTGIGLALCERIVERHGGDIRVDAEPGEGTTISFTLPAAET